MQRIRQLAEIFLLATSGFLLFLLIFQHRVALPAWLQVAGRMHPMVLHFPIVLLFFSLFSWWILPENRFPGWGKSLFLIAAISASVTALMGLLLSLEEMRDGNAFAWHKWTGAGVAFMTAIIYWTYSGFAVKVRLGKTLSLATCLVLIVAGHFGAVLTHGNNYLSAPMAIAVKVPVDEAIVFDDIIQPVFAKCVSCHNAENKKGGLDLETAAGIAEGGKTGPLLKKGDPSMSLLMHRIYLPAGEKKHMPPASKPQLTEEEMLLLHAWISAGSPVKEKLVQLPVQDSFRIIASKYLQGGDTGPDEPVYSFASADPDKISRLNTSFRVVEQLGTGSPALSVQFYGREYFSSQALKELLEVKDQITELNLAKLPVQDENLVTIASFVHLNKLNLNYTPVTDKGLKALLSLKSLQSLSLSGTVVSIDAIALLGTLPQMKSLYIWNTKIDTSDLVSLRKKHPDLQIETGFKDNGITLMALPPPRFETAPGIVSLPARINFTHPVKGVVIRYTTNGSEPDSISGLIFKHPIVLDSNATIVAKAFKNGWYGSKQVRGQYLGKGLKPESVIAITQPDYRYNNGTDILTDGDLGEMRYQNGQWLAYQTINAEYELSFKKPVPVRTIAMNMLENTGAHIFPAVAIEVWDISNRSEAILLGKIKPDLPGFNLPAKIFLEQISFPQREVQRLRLKIHHLEHLPSWHAEKGKPAWVFISEILVN